MTGRLLSRRQDTAIEVIDNEAVAWAVDGLHPCFLDPISHLLYSVMDGTTDRDGLADDVVESLGVEPSVATQQVDRVVRHLDDHRLLERDEGSAVPGGPAPASDGFLRRAGNG